MPRETNRSLRIHLRVSPAEKGLVEEQAAAAGLKVSEYIRREAGIGKFGRADLRGARSAETVAPPAQRPEPADDFEARVSEYQRTMPRRSAVIAVRREQAAERARAALGVRVAT